MSKSYYTDFKKIKKNVRELRRNMTKSETLLWNELRNRKLRGLKFLRQHPIPYKADLKGINYFVADFYCNKMKIVIELDGSIHDETKEYDEFRDEVMQEMGLSVLRIQNDELGDLHATIKKILDFIDQKTF